MTPIAPEAWRLIAHLRSAAGLCRWVAADIRKRLPEEDGAPDAPPRRTPDGLWEADAEEWDVTAEALEEAVAAWNAHHTRRLKEEG